MEEDLQLNLTFGSSNGASAKPAASGPSARALKVAAFKEKQRERQLAKKSHTRRPTPRAIEPSANGDISAAAARPARRTPRAAPSAPGGRFERKRKAPSSGDDTRASVEERKDGKDGSEQRPAKQQRALQNGDLMMRRWTGDANDEFDSGLTTDHAPAPATSTSISSSSSPSATAPDSITASSSSSASSSNHKHAPPRKSLPRIARHAAAELDETALQPVTPASIHHSESVFGQVDEDEFEQQQRRMDGTTTVKTEPVEEIHVKREGQPKSKLKHSTKLNGANQSPSTSTSASAASTAGLPAVSLPVEPAAQSASTSTTPLPSTGFGAMGLSERLHRCLVEKMGLKYPTKIQKEGIPLLLGTSSAGAGAGAGADRRRDALVKSETGTGKTLTYLIPIIELLSRCAPQLDRSSGTRAVILAPTRELCLQIHGVCETLLVKSKMVWIVSGVLMGGEKKTSEKRRLRKGVHILVCTPGRLLDHLENTSSFQLEHLSFFVLDEADRLMDLGFERDLKKIVELLDEKSGATPSSSSSSASSSSPPAIIDPKTGQAIHSARRKPGLPDRRHPPRPQRQNVLVSATLTPQIEKMAAMTLRDPVHIGFKNAPPVESEALQSSNITGSTSIRDDPSSSSSMPVGLVQQYLQVEHRHKIVALAALLRKKVVEAEMNNTHFKCVVFFSTCASVEFHHSLFLYSYWPYDRSEASQTMKTALLDTQVLKMHGNLTQQERTKTYQQFCKMAEGILLCTDVAARGLDLPAVDYIFQYDAPEDTADYVHRVGRTARMGRKGQAILFLTASEMEYLDILKQRAIIPEPLSFSSILQSLHSDAAKNRIYDDSRGGSPAGAILLKQFETLVHAHPTLHESAINAYHAFLRAYAAYPKLLKPVFHPRKLHIGHVARSFALTEAPKALAKSEIVSKQKKAATVEATKEKFEQQMSGKVGKKGGKKRKLSASPSAGVDGNDDEEQLSAGVRPAFGERDRLRNAAAAAADAMFKNRQEAKEARAAKAKAKAATPGSKSGKATSSAWKIGNEHAASGGSMSSKGNKGIDRARTQKVAQQFKRKKLDLTSEFAA